MKLSNIMYQYACCYMVFLYTCYMCVCVLHSILNFVTFATCHALLQEQFEVCYLVITCIVSYLTPTNQPTSTFCCLILCTDFCFVLKNPANLFCYINPLSNSYISTIDCNSVGRKQITNQRIVYFIFNPLRSMCFGESYANS